jgi:hypothetical protein
LQILAGSPFQPSERRRLTEPLPPVENGALHHSPPQLGRADDSFYCHLVEAGIVERRDNWIRPDVELEDGACHRLALQREQVPFERGVDTRN